MNKKDNPLLHFYAIKLAMALKTENGTGFCTEYDNIPLNTLTPQQVNTNLFIKFMLKIIRYSAVLSIPVRTTRLFCALNAIKFESKL